MQLKNVLPFLFIFASKVPFKKKKWNKKLFVEHLAFFIVKNHLHLQFVENVWLKCLVLHLCFCVQFPF
jgi:hypothetical protein